MTAIDWDALFADLMCESEPEPGDPTDDLCPRCNGDGISREGWTCPLCCGGGHVRTIKRKGWDD